MADNQPPGANDDTTSQIGDTAGASPEGEYEALTRLAEEAGFSDGDLDELVAEAKAQEVSSINSGGVAEQLRYLLAYHGLTAAADVQKLKEMLGVEEREASR
ncbi:MAG: hypothetical protein LC800_20680 [Acidobacteria bacterium]|nr:hypothetical protein [Acidobacteriota bacterium]